MGAPCPPYLPSNHSVVLQLLMIRRSAVCAGKLLFTGEGVGLTTTPEDDDPVVDDEPVVDEPVVDEPEPEEDPLLTTLPLVHVCLAESKHCPLQADRLPWQRRFLFLKASQAQLYCPVWKHAPSQLHSPLGQPAVLQVLEDDVVEGVAAFVVEGVPLLAFVVEGVPLLASAPDCSRPLTQW